MKINVILEKLSKTANFFKKGFCFTSYFSDPKYSSYDSLKNKFRLAAYYTLRIRALLLFTLPYTAINVVLVM